MSEIINRSLVHIQTSRTSVILQHGIDHELSVRRVAGEEQQFEIAPGVKIVMCWIPPGEFLMGFAEEELDSSPGGTRHLVRLTQGFWLGKYQVTQAEWEAVMGNNPSYFKGPDLPVETVSWDGVSGPEGFLDKINSNGGAAHSFSLPTEAQWEYACRAGAAIALHKGKNMTIAECACSNLDEVAWYKENSGDKTHATGNQFNV